MPTDFSLKSRQKDGLHLVRKDLEFCCRVQELVWEYYSLKVRSFKISATSFYYASSYITHNWAATKRTQLCVVMEWGLTLTKIVLQEIVLDVTTFDFKQIKGIALLVCSHSHWKNSCSRRKCTTKRSRRSFASCSFIQPFLLFPCMAKCKVWQLGCKQVLHQ